MSVARGIGTATPAPAATSSPWTTRIRSTPTSSRSGSGRSAMRRSRRSSTTRITSPIASTCGATSSSAPASHRRVWDEAAGRWNVVTDQGDPDSVSTVSAQHLVLAVGVLSHPKTPDIPGVETFAGPTYFTSRWPHEGVDFAGQRVGVIGTGSSAIQSIPLIAEQADHLTVFQRTPAFSMPAKNAPLEPERVAARKAEYDAYRQEARYSRIGVVVPMTEELASAADPDEREERFNDGLERRDPRRHRQAVHRHPRSTPPRTSSPASSSGTGSARP